MLMLVEVDLISKKQSYKQNLIWPNSSNGGKIVLVLLIEIITFYIGPTAIDVRGHGFEFILRQ